MLASAPHGDDAAEMPGYAVVIEVGERNYSAYVPDLPGCIAAGATVDEVRGAMQQAIALHIAGLREDGLPVPYPRSVVTTIAVSA